MGNIAAVPVKGVLDRVSLLCEARFGMLEVWVSFLGWPLDLGWDLVGITALQYLVPACASRGISAQILQKEAFYILVFRLLEGEGQSSFF